MNHINFVLDLNGLLFQVVLFCFKESEMECHLDVQRPKIMASCHGQSPLACCCWLPSDERDHLTQACHA